MISQLEHRYRSLLRVLPRWYRAEREEEMVGTFMADRDDDLRDRAHGRPLLQHLDPGQPRKPVLDHRLRL